MSRKSSSFTIPENDFRELEKHLKCRNAARKDYERAYIVMESSKGRQPSEIAKELRTYPNKVIEWKKAYQQYGLSGLKDKAKSGRKKSYDQTFRDNVLKKISEPPPKGYGRWDAPLLAKELSSSEDAIWRLLKKEGIHLNRQRSWCISTDKNFTAKAADIVGLYLNPPVNAMVICVDEKPGIQALERKTGYVETNNGKVMRGIQSTYKRNGTVNLFAALEVATGTVTAKRTQTKTREDFLLYMDELVKEYGSERELHVIVDNYCTHKKNDTWLTTNKNVSFHYTPTSASWLNLVEVWFGIFTRKSLSGASFQSTQKLEEHIKAYVEATNQQPAPFIWKKREVKGSQLKNNIVNLRN
ncbi:MAG TPA: IS630 family transposase [Chitinophagaceae bacterium]|nr:IS630 family transposase [Chitinophagaceae bacterium]